MLIIRKRITAQTKEGQIYDYRTNSAYGVIVCDEV